MVVWRRKLDNDWLHRAERVVERFLTRPETTDQPTCGPGPFSMANADTTTDVLVHAGFEDISLHRCDIEIAIGADLDQAVQFVMALGPAGELIRLAGSQAERRHSSIVTALHAALAELQEPDGTYGRPRPPGSSGPARQAPDPANATSRTYSPPIPRRTHMTIIEEAPFDAAAPSVGRTIMQRGRAVMALVAVAAVAAAGIPSTASATKPPRDPVVTELATFAAPACAGGCGSGSTVGPDKALYVTDGPGGRVLRVDPETGAVTTFASGLPRAIPEVGIGGAIDVAFAGGSAYVLVTLVGPFFGQTDVVDGIYRIEEDGTATAIADIGAWSIAKSSRDRLLHRQRRPVRAGGVPRRIPGHRWAPQPRAARHASR